MLRLFFVLVALLACAPLASLAVPIIDPFPLHFPPHWHLETVNCSTVHKPKQPSPSPIPKKPRLPVRDLSPLWTTSYSHKWLWQEAERARRELNSDALGKLRSACRNHTSLQLNISTTLGSRRIDISLNQTSEKDKHNGTVNFPVYLGIDGVVDFGNGLSLNKGGEFLENS